MGVGLLTLGTMALVLATNWHSAKKQLPIAQDIAAPVELCSKPGTGFRDRESERR